MKASDTTVDSGEVAKFEAIAETWWDPAGKFAPLHRMNPCRLDYITRQISGEFGRDLSDDSPFSGLGILDIGCGGGLLSEPMARLGADVVGADAGEANIAAARTHADEVGLRIDYRATTAEALAGQGDAFDAILAMEIVEHLPDPAAFLVTAAALLKPGGLLFVSTLNRTAKAHALAIIGAEYLLRWLPRGTHDWSRFLTPEELEEKLRGAGLDCLDRKGMVLDPFRQEWRLSDRDLSVNYVALARKPG